jgi:predicted ATPase
MPTSAQASAVPRLTYLRIKNYRALRDVEFRDLTPLTVLIGPNGSGKSMVLDALDFLAEAMNGDLKKAWESRDRFRGMRTKGEDGNIEFEIVTLSEIGRLTYRLELVEYDEKIYIVNEILWHGGVKDRKKVFHASLSIDYKFTEIEVNTTSSIIDDKSVLPSQTFGHIASSESMLYWIKLASSNVDFVSTGVQDFLSTYRLFHLTDDHLKGYSDAGPREKLSPNGDNLPNVLYYLHLRHPEVLARLADKLRAWVPGLADVIPEITSDERLLLRFKDAPFEKPLPAQYMSGGTMRLAALLTLLYEPNATGLLGIEEPENELHPQLLGRLAEELIKATETRQLLVATHSPAILNALEPAQVWILHRGADGYTQATRVADLPGIPELVEEGSPLGYLWTRNFFEVGDPLAAPNATEGR